MKIIMTSLLLIFSLGSQAELVAPKNKNEIKAYYDQIHKQAKLLKTVPDDQLVAELLSACVKAKEFDPNLFCLESLTDFYSHFPETVERVAKEKLSKDDGEFVLKRLKTLRAETILGNDPSE